MSFNIASGNVHQNQLLAWQICIMKKLWQLKAIARSINMHHWFLSLNVIALHCSALSLIIFISWKSCTRRLSQVLSLKTALHQERFYLVNWLFH